MISVDSVEGSNGAGEGLVGGTEGAIGVPDGVGHWGLGELRSFFIGTLQKFGVY